MTTTHDARGTSAVTIWAWLVALMAASLAASALPGARTTAVVAIFAVAVAKALLVARHYMHLKLEPWVVHVIVLVPVLFVVVLAVTLLPDFAFHHH